MTWDAQHNIIGFSIALNGAFGQLQQELSYHVSHQDWWFFFWQKWILRESSLETDDFTFWLWDTDLNKKRLKFLHYVMSRSFVHLLFYKMIKDKRRTYQKMIITSACKMSTLWTVAHVTDTYPMKWTVVCKLWRQVNMSTIYCLTCLYLYKMCLLCYLFQS